MDKGCLGELEDWLEAELRERERERERVKPQILLGLECNK